MADVLAEGPDGRWAARRTFVIVPRQNGKGPHELSTPILTTAGWTTIGEIQPGAEVYGADGRPVKVVACSEVFTDQPCYEVSFTDGSAYVVGEEHLWPVLDRDRGWTTVRTGDIKATYGRVRPDTGRNEYRFRVRCDAVVDTPAAADLPIDPYLLGYWLGDGKRRGADIIVGHVDRDWVTSRLERSGAHITSARVHDHGNAVSLHFRIDAKARKGFQHLCKRLGVWGDKVIPEIYLTASPDQRRALLAGLMDSDGSIATTNRSPQVEFSTSFPRLAESFIRLARSLGIRVARRDGATSLNGKAGLGRARFLWTPAFNPFQMPRKADRFVPPVSRRHELMSITGVRSVPAVPTRCLQIDSADGVYLVGHTFTPTHNSVIEPIELYGLYQLHETILHSAHLFDTAREAFMRIRALIDGSADLSRRVKRINEAHGKEGIELLDRPSKFAGDGTLLNPGGPGGQLRFHARTKGGGRGKSPQRLILDEGFALTRDQMAALLPAISAQVDPQVNVFSTPPPVGQPCEVLMAARAQVLAAIADGRVPQVAWLEWGVERGTDVTLPETWAAANPAYGIRIFEQGCRDELDALGVDEFGVERCGIWPATGTARWLVIPESIWLAATDVPDSPVAPLAFGLEVEWDRSAAAIGVAWRRADGLRQIELTQDDTGVDYRPGTGWCVGRAKQLLKRWPGSTLTLDPGGPAGSLVPHLEDERVPFQKMTLQDAARAYGDFWDGLVGKDEAARNIRHGNQPALNTAIAGAVERTVGDARAWDRQNSVGFAPAGAVTAALLGLRRALVPRSKIY